MSQPDATARDTDVLVVGAGPGCSSIAALLHPRRTAAALRRRRAHSRSHDSGPMPACQ
jgi:flavin-dependent dehydrogenase